MKKHITLTLLILCFMLIISTVTYGWFTYVQRKSVAIFTSNDMKATVSLNDESIHETMSLSNLAFIDFQNDLINDKNNAFNDIAQEMNIKITLDQDSPLSRFLFDIAVSQSEIIYLIILDDQVYDYHLFVSQFIEFEDSKVDILEKINIFNHEQIIIINNQIFFPDESLSFRVVCWADYDQLSEPELYKSYDAEVAIDFRIVSAYGDVS